MPTSVSPRQELFVPEYNNMLDNSFDISEIVNQKLETENSISDNTIVAK